MLHPRRQSLSCHPSGVRLLFWVCRGFRSALWASLHPRLAILPPLPGFKRNCPPSPASGGVASIPRRDVRGAGPAPSVLDLCPACRAFRVLRVSPPCPLCFPSVPGVPVGPLGLPSPPSSAPPTPAGVHEDCPPPPPDRGDFLSIPGRDVLVARSALSVLSVCPACRALRVLRVLSPCPLC